MEPCRLELGSCSATSLVLGVGIPVAPGSTPSPRYPCSVSAETALCPCVFSHLGEVALGLWLETHRPPLSSLSCRAASVRLSETASPSDGHTAEPQAR